MIRNISDDYLEIHIMISFLMYSKINDQGNWKVRKLHTIFFFYHCTVHSDIHTVHSPTDAHLLKLLLKFT